MLLVMQFYDVSKVLFITEVSPISQRQAFREIKEHDCVGVNGGRGTRLRLSQHSQGEAKSLKQHALSFREGKKMFFPVDDNRTWNEM